MTARLDRNSARTGPPAPVRAVHLGLGGFHRAHQAWYTSADPEWGIAAYSFRNTELPRMLGEQDGLYSMLVREGAEPRAEIVGSISRAHPGTDTERWLSDVSAPEVTLITMTVTESAYHASQPGADTAVNRLVAGLERRFRSSGAPVSLVPCDNVPNNGTILREALNATAARTNPELVDWLDSHVHIAETVVDRITPAASDDDQRTVARKTGLRDLAPVTTEPFTEWLIAGEFPSGRPAWERAGARFVDNVADYQHRKLCFLNGAHSLLAYVGLASGCATVREAVREPALAELIGSWWDTATPHSSLPVEDLRDYRERLFDRFSNPGIRHALQQIAVDGSQKIPARILPVLRAERARNQLPISAATGLGGWVVHLRDGEVRDARASELVPMARSAEPVRAVLSAVDAELGSDSELIAAVSTEVERLTRTSQRFG